MKNKSSKKTYPAGSIFDNENDTPILGKMYNVRCAKMQEYCGKIHYVPIIGKRHIDKQFSVNYEHYHIDGRFKSKLVYHPNGYTNQIISADKKRDNNSIYGTFIGIEIKRRKCIILTTGIMPPSKDKQFKNSDYMKWYNSFIGKSCKGKKCPHLGTTMFEVDGRLVCPLHKLQGCLTSEKIIEYVE